jgi:hypothetical protein
LSDDDNAKVSDIGCAVDRRAACHRAIQPIAAVSMTTPQLHEFASRQFDDMIIVISLDRRDVGTTSIAVPDEEKFDDQAN